jgi:hypothetical protein
MRALRYHGVKDLRVDHDIPEPKCGDNQIKVKRKSVDSNTIKLRLAPLRAEGVLVMGVSEMVELLADANAMTIAAFCGICGTDCKYCPRGHEDASCPCPGEEQITWAW